MSENCKKGDELCSPLLPFSIIKMDYQVVQTIFRILQNIKNLPMFHHNLDLYIYIVYVMSHPVSLLRQPSSMYDPQTIHRSNFPTLHGRSRHIYALFRLPYNVRPVHNDMLSRSHMPYNIFCVRTKPPAQATHPQKVCPSMTDSTAFIPLFIIENSLLN